MRLKSQEITLHWWLEQPQCRTVLRDIPAPAPPLRRPARQHRESGSPRPDQHPGSRSHDQRTGSQPYYLGLHHLRQRCHGTPPPQTTVPRHSTSSRSTTSSLGCRLVGNIVTYIAGFVVKKALDSVSCSTCQEALVSDIQPDDMTQLYHLFIISAR
ncbi:uncharacterized protein LOC122370815 [Amphibalanus amphitrite]|uniref:uncharacterized protein LOC122370815 n=1 Tax=Amphibalanus amphitrite TaxID=1232801 RepID=UPI001C912A3D|nr:uncharacterized protein LOC122370815 [Amphibalanus amphitrite]XP_043202676.1 uncharacterized protein LOC122370815 [Amphibalanus amphitrite]XP_043202677.1 uncharacterized protein LOC122370815 [Amphibalanus amphitrite]